MSDDIIATVDCMRNLGANIISHGDKLEVVGIDTRLDRELTFDCNESGSTLRFMLPIALSLNGGVNKLSAEASSAKDLWIYIKISA